MNDDAIVVPEVEGQFVVAIFAYPRQNCAGEGEELVEEEGNVIQRQLDRIAIEREGLRAGDVDVVAEECDRLKTHDSYGGRD